jgi:DNA-binding IclR family transcriptional regulator
MDAILNSIPPTKQDGGQTVAQTGEQAGKEGGKDTYLQLVPAVDQATRILFILASTVSGESSLTEIAKETGISKSKGLAILNTLRGAGLVTRNERTKAYQLGPRILVLSRALVNHTDLAQSASPYLEALVSATGCTALLGVVSGETVFIVARRHAPGGTFFAFDVGHRYPLTWGAHGRAILASMSPEELEKRLGYRSIIQAGETAKDAVDVDQLRAEIEESRRLGYAMSMGSTWSGLNAIAAVLTVDEPEAATGQRVAGCLVAVGTFAADQVEGIGRSVVDTAAQMSTQLGPLLQTVNLHFPLSRPLES